VHGKGNLFQQMPGDDSQKFANLRSLYAYMFTHPGKKTLFMGMEFGQTTEWNAWLDLNWSLLNFEPHQKLKQLVADLNALYKQERSLYTDDFSAHGFEWIDCNDADNSVVSFIRQDKYSDKFIVTVCNFTPRPHYDYWVGVPQPGYYRELLNTDSQKYGGSGVTNVGGKHSHEWDNPRWPHALSLTLPPLGVAFFKLD